MISPDSPLGLPVEAPFNGDPLEKLILGSEEGPSSDHYDPTSINGNDSEGSLPSIEETAVEDLLLVEGGEKIDAGRLVKGDVASATQRVRDTEKSDPLTGENQTEDTLTRSTKNSKPPAPIQTRSNKQKPNIKESQETDPLINPKKDKSNPQGQQKKEEEKPLNISFDSGIFEVGKLGVINADFLYDGGVHKGELAIFSIEGFEDLPIRSYEEFVKEAASRALSNSELGHVIISDREEGARFDFPLGEKSRNGGEYLGHKTFKMTPRDKFALMLVPKSTVEKVFQNPKERGAKNALFSFSTDNPDDLFWEGQLGEVNDKGGIYAWEDSRLDGKSDLDYNDIIFCLTGAKGSVSHLDQLINNKKDWRETQNASEILEKICHGSDLEPPIISAELANDTGSDDSDKITSDPAINGTVTDDNYLKTFVAGFEETSLEFELITEIDELGNFELSLELLEEIKGEKLEDGTHSLYLQATDDYDNKSEVYEFSFALDTKAELTLELDSEFDSLPEGDNITNFETVTLIGQTEANATVILDETGETVIADEEGNFEFVEVGLELGENTFNATVEDLAGNEESITLTLEKIKKDTEAPANSLELANDTGSDDGDKITSDPTISGTITEENEIETFLVSFDENNLEFELKNNLDSEGNFELTRELLEEIKGELLADGTHTFYLKATDNFDNISEISEFSFTLDTGTELTFELDENFDSPPEGDGITEEEIVTLIGRTEPNQIVTLEETGETVTADDEGNFEFAEISLELGENTFNAGTEDLAGNIKNISLTIERIEKNDIILLEESNFNTTATPTLELPENPSFLNIKLTSLDFDNADTDAINDALEIALVDESGQSLVQTTGSDKQAFFNWTESQEILLAEGVTYDETEKLIRVNLTDIPADTTATLVFRLVNNDSDTTTTATIEDFYLTAAPDGVESPIETEFDGDSVPDPISDTEFSSLTDISASFQPEYQRTSYNSQTQQLIAEYSISNEGQYAVRTPLLVAIANISDPTVKVRDPDGFTPEGLPYYNFSDKVTGDKLDPDETTGVGNLVFYNPEGVQFDYELQILGRELSGPIIDSEPDLEIIAGQSYSYDVDATHPDDDTLTYELLASPEGMSIDGETGVIVWDTEVEDVANHAISVKVTDSEGLEDIQTFTLEVIETPPNRPPNFTSTPEVDAWINQVYNYDADATDPDNDSLKYDLIIGPEGMTVNPDTGEIEWTPPPVLVLGDTVLGRINLPGDEDEFSFSGIKGQRIYFDPLFADAGGTWYFDVYGPDGELVVDSDLTSNQIITLEKTGNYRVVVDAAGDYTGGYGFSTIDVGMVPVAVFDKVIEGSLSPGSEDDVYRFTGNEGQKLFFDKLSNSGSLDWVLYGPDNKAVPGGSSSDFSDLELYLPLDGEYILTLRGKGGFDDKIDYSFEIITPDEITTPINLGSNDEPNSIYAEIGEKGEEDFYTFEGKAGQRIYWDRLFLNAPSKSIYAQIHSPSETQIESRYFDDQDSIPITLNEDGTYRVRIDATGENLGTYSFSILDPGLATQIELDTPIDGTLEPGQEAHFYSFEAEKEQRLFLDTTGESSGTNWTLYDSGSNQISHASLNTDIEVVLDDADTYTLAIRGYNGNNPVDYSFEVITPDTHEGTFAVGEIVSGDIGEKGERDVYTFTGSKGQRLFFDRLVGGSEKKVTLESPSGTKLINELSMSSDYYQHPTILPEDGTYEFTVDGYLEGLGDYSFRLVDATASPVLEMDTPIEGTLDPGMGIEFYQFEGTGGERIYFQSEGNSPSSYWRLYSPDNKLLSPSRISPSYYWRALNTDFEYVLPGDGTYYLMLQGERTEETPYNIQLVPTDEPDASFELNSWVDAAIEDLGDRDVHTFTGVVGQTLYFDPRAGNANIDVQIHSPSGKLIFNGDTSSDSPPFTLTEAGIYKVSVDSYSDVTGDYSFRVTNSTTTLTLEETVSGSVSKGETALYRFEGTAGQQLKFDSLMSVSGADWILYAPTTEPNNSLNIGFANLSNDFARVLPVDGDYILAVRNRTDSDVNYEFQVNDVSPAPNTNEGPISIELETLRSGQISVVDEVDEYKFTLDAPTAIFFDGLQSDANIMARLYAPDGTTQIFNNRLTNTDYGAYQLTEMGDYKLEVYGYRGATGDYNFKLVDLAAASLLELDTITDASLNSNETVAYKFDGEAGQKVRFDGLNAVNPSVNARLLNSSGEEITSTTNLHQDIARLQNLEADGEYYLVLQSNNSSDTTASFKLLDASGSSILERNVNQDATLNPWESLVYKFEGEAGEKVWIDGLNASHSGVKAWLFNSSGRQIGENNYAYNTYTGMPNDIFLETLEADGEYYLVLESKNNENTATTFRLLDDDSATPLIFDTDVNGGFNPTGKEAFLYKFTGVEGQRLYFDTQNSNATEKIWQVYAPSGESLQWKYLRDDLEQLLPVSGEYFLSLYTNNNATGTVEDYEFRVVTPEPQETAISIGDTIEGQIEELGQQNTYTFTGTEGQRLWFDGLEGTAITAKLYSPGKQELFSVAVPNDNGPFTLNEAGTYRLVVDGNGDSLSNYSFRFLDIDEAAIPVSLDEDISGSFGPSLRELHLYNFEADKDQYAFFDRQQGTYHQHYPNYYTVYGNDDSAIWNQALSSDSETALPYAGEYVLAFRPAVNNPGSEYSLRMVTPEFVTSPLTLGETVSSTISEQGEWDTYTFTGTPGQMLYFDSLEYPSWEVKAKLIAPSGKQVWNQNVRDDSRPFALPEAGQYELIVDVDANNDLHDTSYSFRLLDFADAMELNLDVELSGSFGESKRETHLYKFAGTEGDHLFFDRKDGYIYNYYTLYNSFGQEVFNQHLDRDIEKTLPATGDYFLAFRSFGSANDVYQLEVVTPDEVATPLNYGETISSEIAEPGERDAYSFEGTEGEILYFDSLKYQGTLRAKLIAPDGEEIGNQYVRDDKEPFVLKESGTYILEVDSAENNQETGSYDFRLLNFADAPELTLDATVSGDFEPGLPETILHRLTGNKGDYLYFESVAGHISDSYALYRGDEPVFSQRLDYDYELELSEDGEYVLALHSNGAEPDNYELKIVTPELTTTPLILGEVINDDIRESGERDFYTFEGSVGQKLFFDSVEENSNIKARLFSPTEIKVIDSHVGADWSPFTLTEAGTYRLEVDANNNVVGDYGFVLSDRSSATLLELDTPTTGTLELGNDVDLYQFDGKQGQTLNFDLDAERWSGANWVLYKPDNGVLAQPSATQPDFQATLPSDGLYTLAIAGSSSESVSYGFEVTDETQAPLEHTGFNTIESGNIIPNSVTEYTFNATAGTQFFYDGISSPWYTRATLKNPDGSSHPAILDRPVYEDRTGVLNQTGEYTLQLYSYYGNAGDYQFQLLELPNSLRSPNVNYLEIGGVVSDTLELGTEAKVYTFEGVEGLRLMFNGIVGYQVGVTLYNPDGTSVFSRNDFRSGDIAPVTLTDNGLYHLVIQGQASGQRDYSFQLLDFSTSPELAFNVKNEGKLSPGQSQFYQFEGTSGETLFFDSISGSSGHQWKLYGEGNNQLKDVRFDTDFSLELPYTGKYALLIQHNNSTTPLDYEFRVFRHPEEETVEIITPGTGEGVANEDGSLGTFPVQIEVEDTEGGKDVQDYNVRVWADPDNGNPVITSTPQLKFGLNDDTYQYQLQSFDPDGDTLTYRLALSPVGALIDKDTGELLWFPKDVADGDTVTFSVDVADSRGGKDTQSFEVEVHQATGQIQGAVFEDLNGNGFRDTKLVKGDNPAIVLAIDVSGSTEAPFPGPDGIETVLDAQVAATLALVDSLVGQGYGDRINIGLIPHNTTTQIQDMNPAEPGVQPYATPNADADNNGIPDIREILESYYPHGHNDFSTTLQIIENLFDVLPGDPNLIFMSDGYGHLDAEVAETVVANLEAKNVNTNAFGIGLYSTIETIKKIDPDAVQLTDVEEFVDILAGWNSDYVIEPLIEGIAVYIDENDNGVWDEGEASQVSTENNTPSLLGSTKVHYSFEGLIPGTYNLRAIVPDAYTQTAPATEFNTATITDAGETLGRWFGIYKEEEPPNAPPEFLTTAPDVVLDIGDSLVYHARAMDPDAEEVTFDLVNAPEGMSVDGSSGTVVWIPTRQQFEDYYAALREERQRLIDFGRSEFAPEVVEFNVLLRAKDPEGEQALQSLAIELVEPNNAPVFTSTLPDNANAKVGQEFKYQAVAQDADGDALIYSLIDAPTGVVIDAETGLLSWTPTQETAVEFEIKATDGRGGEAVQEISLPVKPAPVLPPLNLETVPNTAVKTGELYSYQLPAGLSFNLTESPSGMTVDSNGLLTWTADELGVSDVVLEAKDTDGNTVVQSWQIEVGTQGVNRFPVIVSTTDPEFLNQPPEIVSSPRISTRSDKVYFYQVDTVDPDGDSLEFELLSAPQGMEITESGVLSWLPTAADFGFHDVDVAVSDGLWQTVQSWSLFVSDRTTNSPPSITSVPNTVTNTERLYQYQLSAFDADGDLLLWSLDEAPAGMVVNPTTGMMTWQPTVEQIGSHSVAVRVIDSSGAYVGQQFDLRVTGINTPPEIVSVPLTKAAPASEYSYKVVATDPENDRLEFGLGVRPEGMSIDTEAGAISWLPATLGSFEVEVLVTDAQGATNRQSYSVEVGEGNANGAPTIVSSPVFVAAVGSAYSYDVDAVDPDGDALSYQLIAGPSGMVMDAESGVLSWSSPVLGTHNVVVGASDGTVGAAQGFVLAAIENAAPTFDDSSVPPAVAVPDKLYSYDVLATDPNGERLLYGLDDASVALGMTLDEFGRLRWTPTAADAGTHRVTVTVTDGTGASAEQSFDVTVTADTVAPVVELRPLSGYYRSGDDYSAEVGTNVTFVVSATDNVGVTGLRLDVDGVAVAVDGNGLASVPFNNVGSAVVSAVAVDAAGNSGSADFEFSVVDFSDTLPPTAILDDAISSEPITSFADVLGTVTDDGAVEYVLEVAPVAGGEFVEVASGSGAVENGKLGSFDPSVLQNDSYVLRLTATDGGGNSSRDEVVVDVAGSLKLGNFRLSFTDLEIPLSGIPISVTRTYDSLNASERDDFGYGWRLEFRDTDLRTSVRRRTPEEELLGVQSPFSEGERVYVTLPGGERTGFTFKPRGSHLNGYLSYPEAFMYHPEFVADDGGELTLRVKDVNLVRKTGTDEFVENGSGVPYNPADVRFGGVYELVTKEGVVYTIDAVSGDLLTVTDRNDNKLTFSDAGIVSSTGVAVSFERDAKGRIVGVVDPEGNRIGYEYDEFGDLVGVTDREDNTTEFVYDADDRPHYLEEIIDPLGRSGVRTEYDELGRLQRMLDVNGEAVELVYDPDNSTQTVRDVFGNPTTYVYDDRGNVVTEVDPVGKVVKRTYDEDNNVLSETVVTDESGPDGWTTSFTYDAGGNKLTETDPLGNTTRWTYNRFGQVLTETDPLGNTTTNTYSPNGNLLSVTDAEGNVTNFSYDIRGNLLSVTDAKNRVTQFQYDLSGNVLETTDALGGKTVYSYDSMGNRLSETRTVTVTNGVEELVSEWDYDNEGQVLSMTDALNNVTKYEYDAAGNQIAVIDAKSRRTESVYDDKGQLVETIYPDETPDNLDDNYKTIEVYDKGGQKRASIDESGRVTHYRYDAVGQLVETFYPDGMDTLEQFVAAVAPGKTDVTVDWSEVVYPDAMLSFVDDNPSSKTEYYESGQVRAQIDELGNRVEFRYDDAGRLLQTIYPDDTPLDLSDNPRSRVEYDNAGRRVKDIDANGRTTEFVYDELGRVKETLLADGTSTQTVYDAVGQKVADIDQLGNRTEYEYDKLGRLTDVVQFLDGREIRTEYGYDELGRQVWQEDALDRRTLYEYDLMGRRTAVVLPMGQRSSTVYDAVGNASRTTDFNGETAVYSYDPLNRLTFIDLPNDADVSFAYTPTGLRESVTDSRGVTSYAYDERNRLIGRTDAVLPYLTSGATIEYEYDDAGNRTLVRTPGGVTRYEFDERNQLEKVVADGGETVYEYDAVGNLVKTVLPNGVVESRVYDELNRLEFLENKSGDAVVSSYDYELDDVGNRVAVTEHDGRRVEYVYDSLYRLVSEEVVGEGTTGYVYDDVGNRLKKVDSVETTYTYDDNDRLVEESSGGEVVVYEYDDNGNTISETVNGVQEKVYVWDDRNRLVEVRFADGKVVGYGYDDGNIRVSEVVDGVEKRFLLDKNRANAQVLEKYVDGALDAEYVYGLDLISQTRDGVDSNYLVDGLGSTRGLTDASGGVVAGYSYDAFGNLVGSSGDVENDYLFAGEQFDGELGQYYLRQRFYDSGVGRFTRRDVFEGRLREPITLHKYLYGNGNPVTYTDPTGLYSLTETNAAVSIANILNEIQSWQAQQLFGMTAGGDEPTPSSIGWEALFGLGLETAPFLIAAFSSAGQAIIKTVGRVTNNFKIGECDLCAEAVQNELIRRGIRGKRIRIETGFNKGAGGNIWSDKAGELISYNGFHEANVIEIDGVEMVFDNIHPEGIPKADWYADMATPSPNGFTEILKEEY